jgi:hypothetical protein
MKSKADLQQSLAKIMEAAKCHRDFADSEYEKKRWEEIILECNEALEKPSMVDIISILEPNR